MSTYREFSAPAPLRDLVRCGWQTSLDATAPARRRRVLPDGCMDLIWLDNQVVVAGPDRSAFHTLDRPGTTVTGLRFHPGAAPGLLGVPASEVRDQRVALRELNAGLADRAEQLLAGGTPPQRALAGTVCAARRSDTGSGQLGGPEMRRAAGMLAAGGSVAATADALGWTTRTLHRRATEWFGYGPATLRRVLRFRAALALARAGLPAAETAVRSGYADQAHLCREVRDLAGVTLAQLLADSSGANSSTGLPSGSPTTA